MEKGLDNLSFVDVLKENLNYDYRERMIISENTTIRFLLKYHMKNGYIGASKMASTIKKFYYINSLDKNINTLVSICQLNKSGHARYNMIKGFLKANYPLEKVSSYIYDPFEIPEGETKRKLFLVFFSDMLLRYTLVRALVHNTASELTNFFAEELIKKLKHLLSGRAWLN